MPFYLLFERLTRKKILAIYLISRFEIFIVRFKVHSLFLAILPHKVVQFWYERGYWLLFCTFLQSLLYGFLESSREWCSIFPETL